MQKKVILASLILIVLILSFSFVSANAFTDFLDKLFGKRPQLSPGPYCDGADTNKDGSVDATDLARVRELFGTSCELPGYCKGTDIDKSETVDANDLGIIRSSFGATCTIPADCQNADIDQDGDVDTPDYLTLVSRLGETGCSAPDWCGRTDMNQDTLVDQLDLDILIANFDRVNCAVGAIYYAIYDSQGTNTDLVIITDFIADIVARKGINFQAIENSEITKQDLQDKISVFVHNGNGIVIYKDDASTTELILVTDLLSSLQAQIAKNIQTPGSSLRAIKWSEVISDDLKETMAALFPRNNEVDRCSELNGQTKAKINKLKLQWGPAQTLQLSNTKPSETPTLFGKIYLIELIAASDTSATIKVTDSTGYSATAQIQESSFYYQSKTINGILVTLISADENTALSTLSAEIIVGDKKVVRKEGEQAREDDYLVTSPDSGGKVFEVSVISNTSDSTDDIVELRDVITYNSIYIATIVSEGRGTIVINGKTHYLTYLDDKRREGEDYIVLTWGTGASSGNPGDEADTFFCENQGLTILNDDFWFDQSVVEIGESARITESIEVPESEKDIVPETRIATIVRPSGQKDSIQLTKQQYVPNCYDHWLGGIRCQSNYEGTYTTTEQGLHPIFESPYGATLYVAEQGFINANLVTHPDSSYSLNFWGHYDQYDNSIDLNVNYYPNNINEQYQAGVIIFETSQEAKVKLDNIAASFSNQFLSSIQNVNGNTIYVIKHPTSEDIFVYWKSNNKVIAMAIYPNKQGEEISIEDFIKGLSGKSRGEFVSLDYYNLPNLFRIIAEQYFDLHPSDLTDQTCYSYWECETLPILCPEYGKQIQTCTDRNGCSQQDIISEIECQPGACSGCYLPADYQGGIQKCVPFGFRLELSGANAFCDIGGQTYQQKSINDQCQNNFECSSNQCSDGLCVGLVEEVRSQTGLLVKIFCKIFYPLSDTGYQGCLDQFASGGSSSGGGGGGSPA